MDHLASLPATAHLTHFIYYEFVFLRTNSQDCFYLQRFARCNTNISEQHDSDNDLELRRKASINGPTRCDLSMNAIPWSLAGNFVVLILLQVTAISLLPRTHGFTDAGATLAVLTIFAMSYWLMVRIVHSGVSLGILLPLMAAAVPLGPVAAGVIFAVKAHRR